MAPKKKLIYAEDLHEMFCNTFYPDELRKTFVFGNDVHKVAIFFGKKSRELIENAPAVDAVEVVHGHWIEHSLVVGGECSVCGWQFQWFENAEAHYCPHCGAKMDGGNSNAD